MCVSARPCDRHGNFLPPDIPPPPPVLEEEWDPFADRPTFEFAELLVKKMHASTTHINELLRIQAAKRALETNGEDTDPMFFGSANDIYNTIESIPYGEAPWTTYQVRLKVPEGAAVDDTPWKYGTYEIHARNIEQVLLNMAASPEFDGKWDYGPYEEFTAPGVQRFSNLMSGRFAYRQAVST